jgi:predicted permease
VFVSLSQHYFNEIFNPTYLVAYSVGALVIVGVGYFIGCRLFGLSKMTSTFYVMGMACSNSGFVGYPILLLTVAPIAGISLSLNMIVENLIVLPLLLAMAEQARQEGGGNSKWESLRQTFARLARNPLILALVAGMIVSSVEIRVPQVLLRSVDLFAKASGSLSLFFIGGMLFGLPIRGLGKRVLPIMLGKLILHPGIVYVSVYLLVKLGMPPLSFSMTMAMVTLAAVPMMSIYPILGQVYGEEDLCSAAMLLTTIASFFSLSALLWGFRHLL